MTPWEVDSVEEAREFIKALKPTEQKRVLEGCLWEMDPAVVQAALKAFDLVDA